MKGQGFEIIGLFIITAVVIPILMFLPIVFLRIHLVGDIEFLSKDNSVQLLMLSILSTTYSGKPTSQIIAEHVAFNSYPNINQILATEMGRYTDLYSCYRISANGNVLSQSSDSSCDPTKYVSETYIPLPYNNGVTSAKITLGIG